jgi:lysophospholipase L1-like esterase
MKALAKNLTLTVVSLVVFLLGAEGLCRLLKPDVHLFPDHYAEGDVLFRGLVYDPVIGFVGRPGALVGNLDERLNRRGLRGPDFPDEKRPGVVRIVALGDSCTFNAQAYDTRRSLPMFVYTHPFTEFLADMLRPYQRPDRRYEVINAGVVGYDTREGLRFLRDRVLDWHPDVILLRFGWNDQWLLRGFQGGRPEPRDPRVRRLYWGLLHSRLYAFMKRFLTTTMEALPRRSPLPPFLTSRDEALAGVRVPPDEFAFNLRLMIREARDAGILPVVMNAPRGEAKPSLVRGPALGIFVQVAAGYATLEDIFRVHDRYNAIAKRVAEEENAPFVDLDAAFAAAGRADLFGPTEAIHPDEKGNRLIARLTLEELIALGVVRPIAPPPRAAPPRP